MNFKRALWMGFLAYFISALLGIFAMAALGLDVVGSDPSDIPINALAILIVVSAIIICLFTFWYFKKVKPTTKEGFLFGLVVVVIGFILDAVTLLFGYGGGEYGFSDLIVYYRNPFFWGTVILLLIVTSFVGFLKSKR